MWEKASINLGSDMHMVLILELKIVPFYPHVATFVESMYVSPPRDVLP